MSSIFHSNLLMTSHGLLPLDQAVSHFEKIFTKVSELYAQLNESKSNIAHSTEKNG